MTRLYLKGSWNKNCPPAIILPTRDMVKVLGEYLSSHAEMHASMIGNLELQKEALFREIVETVLINLIYKDNAILCLDYEALTIAQDTLTSYDQEGIEAFSKRMHEFGLELYELLIEIGAYQNGQLNYVFHGLLANDIILMHRDYSVFDFTVDRIVPWQNSNIQLSTQLS